jgi:dipeptide/tripeptide permease
MKQSRCKRILIGTIGLVVLFGAGLIMNFYLGEITISILWGSIIGIVLSIISCLYMADAYDLATMHPKDPSAPFANNRGYIGVILGGIVANIITQFFGIEVRNLVMGCSLVWIFITMGFMAFHLCQNQSKSWPK